MSRHQSSGEDSRSPNNASRLAAILAIAGFLLLLAWLGFKAWRLATLAQSLQSYQQQAETLLAGGALQADPDQTEALVMNLRRDVAALDGELRPFLPITTRLGWLPRVGPLLEHSRELLEMADAGTQAAAYSVRALKPALVLLQDEQRDAEGLLPRLLPVVAEGEADLLAASAALDRAIAARANIDRVDDFPWRVRTVLEMIDSKLYLADELRLLTVLPELLGADEPKSYLILAQNEDEIRPTGGFLTGAGILLVDNGDIVSLTFQDGNVIDDWRNKPYDLPPEPLYRLMGLELFLFRDANFWPDFPTSAEKAIELYNYGQDSSLTLDGAIAIDQQFVSMLVGVTGPIQVSELETTVRSSNVIDSLRNAWGASEGEEHSEWIGARKDFLGPLAQAIRRRLLGEFESIDPLFLAETMHLAAQQKHLQIYSRDPAVANVLDAINWDGRLEVPSSGDFLMILDTNVGYNKSNSLVESAANYEVQLREDGTAHANLRITYTHNGTKVDEPCEQGVAYVLGITYSDIMNKCYWNYLRIYTPQGSSPIQLASHPTPAGAIPMVAIWEEEPQATVYSEGNTTVIANRLVVPQGESLSSEYEYELPVVVRGDGTKYYSLKVAKQPGVRPLPLSIQVSLPPGASVMDAPASGSINGQTFTLDAELSTDMTFEISFR